MQNIAIIYYINILYCQIKHTYALTFKRNSYRVLFMNAEIKKLLCLRIKNFRESTKLSQEKFCEKAEIDVRTNIPVSVIFDLAKALTVSPKDFFLFLVFAPPHLKKF